MIRQEIKIAAFVLGLCLFAAVATSVIYERGGDTTASAWLLLPIFALIAIAIFVSECLVRRKAEAKDAQVDAWNAEKITWAFVPEPSPAVIVAFYVLSFSAALPPVTVQPQQTRATAVTTPSESSCVEDQTLTTGMEA